MLWIKFLNSAPKYFPQRNFETFTCLFWNLKVRHLQARLLKRFRIIFQFSINVLHLVFYKRLSCLITTFIWLWNTEIRFKKPTWTTSEHLKHLCFHRKERKNSFSQIPNKSNCLSHSVTNKRNSVMCQKVTNLDWITAINLNWKDTAEMFVINSMN